jgi:cyclic pyranopterin phosphate synthase
MVDVGDKPVTRRYARAWGRILLAPETLAMITSQGFAKGDVFGAARIAGVLAAKRTGDLIPLCHPLPLTWAGVELIPIFPKNNDSQAAIIIVGEASLNGRTGIEMEALTAVTIAGLTVYDMCKAVDKAMSLTDVSLLEKKGGRSGHYFARERAGLLQDIRECELKSDDLVVWKQTENQRIEFRRYSDNSEVLLGRVKIKSDVCHSGSLPGTGVVVLGQSLLCPGDSPGADGNSGLLRVVKPGAISQDAIFAGLGV